MLLLSSTANAAWFDASWTFRRSLDVSWDPELARGNELAQVDVSTAGKNRDDGADVRVATDDGHLVRSRVLGVGPGDFVRVVFMPVKGIRGYYIYFGNPNPPPPPKGTEDVDYDAGLLMEMKQWTGGAVDNFKQVEDSWKRSQPLIGRMMVDRAFLGVNPFGAQEQTISKFTGSLFAPLDGNYLFAASADDKGALYIDGKPLIFAPFGPGDIRFKNRIDLQRGQHEFVFFHVNTAGDGRFSVGWQRPDQGKVDVIPKDSFSPVLRATIGSLEEIKRPFTSDFKVDYQAECFVNNAYFHRYHFAAHAPSQSGAWYDWDMGDGQTARGEQFDHVYLTDGIYPVRLTTHVGVNSDTQTTRISVHRDWMRLAEPPTDEPPVQSKIVARYDVAKMPIAWLDRATWLHLRAGQPKAALDTAGRLATEKTHGDSGPAFGALHEMVRLAMESKSSERLDEAIGVLNRVPNDSDFQPRAARLLAQTLLWGSGDFAKAMTAIEPFKSSSDDARRVYAQAQTLAGHADEARKTLESLSVSGSEQRRVALSGALARTIEYYIEEGDWEHGQEQWERWQTQYPTDFLEGYSLLLRVRLMEIRGANAAAAKVAEAFAAAVPTSSYAPQLLDTASKLIAKTDPAKSRQLRDLLKQRYPEDPLSQDK